VVRDNDEKINIHEVNIHEQEPQMEVDVNSMFISGVRMSFVYINCAVSDVYLANSGFEILGGYDT